MAAREEERKEGRRKDELVSLDFLKAARDTRESPVSSSLPRSFLSLGDSLSIRMVAESLEEKKKQKRVGEL